MEHPISCLGQEKYMVDRFVAEMTKVESIIRKKIVWRGLVNSMAQSIPFFGYTIALCYGGFLMANEDIELKDFVKCVFSELLIIPYLYGV